MAHNFETYIIKAAQVTEEEAKLIVLQGSRKRVRKRQMLLHEGEVCKHKIFVERGLMRSYLLKDDGTEYIMRFATENTWLIDPESYHSGLPTKYNVDALEDCDVLLWTREAMDWLAEKIPALKAYSDRLKTNTLTASMGRIMMNISGTSEEKYQEFIETYPEVFNRVPLHMVASYLGVSRETLSRIRHTQMKQLKGQGNDL